MDRNSIERMRLDRRLIRRRNWIPQKQLQRELDALPDVADKVAPIESEDEAATQPPPSD